MSGSSDYPVVGNFHVSYVEVVPSNYDLYDKEDVYLLQNQFPKEERYALGDQVRRAATSITANLAEGSGRQSPKLPSSIILLTSKNSSISPQPS